MVSRAHGNLAEDAAAYLAKGANATESLSGDPKEIDGQAARLVEWARKRNVLLTDAYTADLETHIPLLRNTRFYRISDNRAVKGTYPERLVLQTTKKANSTTLRHYFTYADSN